MAKRPKKSSKSVDRDPTGKIVSKVRARPRFFDWRTVSADRLKGGSPELLTYKDRLAELLEYQGQFVVIKGSEVVGIYRDREEALDVVDDQFGDDGALVKQIVTREPIHSLGGAAF